ncbi:uncharacterized protein LY89DRAFT_116345 [Mollisia scopiformis]|uniref:Uncharacterized protein n=1 Tax=Mollisia scopiformis TaxID=149040 RepID=A0A194X665_MOLSC|nr:uncharacterized protein LY89DRAFT_116345 [Mollisia scopiformis]KUJ15554.1 hypothetical protein LY89DRAFT_116345 [Mollisia scopiformis]
MVLSFTAFSDHICLPIHIVVLTQVLIVLYHRLGESATHIDAHHLLVSPRTLQIVLSYYLNIPNMLKELPPSPLALLSPSHPEHRAARKEIEKHNPHFNTKDLAMKAGILALLAGIACYPRIKAEAELLGEKGKDKLKEEGRKGRKKWDEFKDDVEDELHGHRRSESVETRPSLEPRMRSRSEGWQRRGDKSREWDWDDRRHRYKDRRDRHTRY